MTQQYSVSQYIADYCSTSAVHSFYDLILHYVAASRTDDHAHVASAGLFPAATGPEHRGRGGGRKPRGDGKGGGGAAIPGGSVLGQICDDLLELQENAGQVRDAARHDTEKRLTMECGTVIVNCAAHLLLRTRMMLKESEALCWIPD